MTEKYQPEGPFTRAYHLERVGGFRWRSVKPCCITCQTRPQSHDVPLRSVFRCWQCGARWITYKGDYGVTWRRKWLPAVRGRWF